MSEAKPACTPEAYPKPPTPMASATLALPAVPTTSLLQVAASRITTASRSGALQIRDSGLSLHLTARGDAAAAVARRQVGPTTTREEWHTAAAAYQVDLDLNVAFDAALQGERGRLAALDPALLKDFTAAFNALDGSKAHQRAFFRATDRLFDGLEREIGLSPHALDDEAEVVKGAVRAFFRQVKSMQGLVHKTVAGVARVADDLARRAAEIVSRVATGDAPAVRRLRQADRLVEGAPVEGDGRRHLRHLVDRLLARGDAEGRGEAVRGRLDRARPTLEHASPHTVRRAGHTLERALNHEEAAEGVARRFIEALAPEDDAPLPRAEGRAA